MSLFLVEGEDIEPAFWGGTFVVLVFVLVPLGLPVVVVFGGPEEPDLLLRPHPVQPLVPHLPHTVKGNLRFPLPYQDGGNFHLIDLILPAEVVD